MSSELSQPSIYWHQSLSAGLVQTADFIQEIYLFLNQLWIEDNV